MTKMYLQSKTKPEDRFEILSFDQKTQIAKMKGRYATIFEQPITVERMNKYGYELVRAS